MVLVQSAKPEAAVKSLRLAAPLALAAPSPAATMHGRRFAPLLAVTLLFLFTTCTGASVQVSSEGALCSPYPAESAVREPDRSEDYTMAIQTFDGGAKNTRIVVVEGGLRRPVPGSEEVETFSWNRDGTGFFVTRDGVLGFLPIEGGELHEIYGDWSQVRFPVPSPDGQTLAVSVNLTDDTGSGWEIWLLGRNGENPRPVTAGYDPSWSPDGTKLYFEQHEPSVRLAVLDFATGQTTSFLTGPDRDRSVEVSPRGTYAAFSRGRARLMLYTFADSTLVALTDGSYYDRFVSFSADEEYVVFYRQVGSSRASGAIQIIGCDLTTGRSRLIEEGEVHGALFAPVSIGR